MKSVADHKLKKSDGPLKLDLVENPDILAELGATKTRPFLVGFAAETKDVAKYARSKLLAKKIDVIAANQVGDGQGLRRLRQRTHAVLERRRKDSCRARTNSQLARALLEQIVELRTSRKRRNP